MAAPGQLVRRAHGLICPQSARDFVGQEIPPEQSDTAGRTDLCGPPSCLLRQRSHLAPERVNSPSHTRGRI